MAASIIFQKYHYISKKLEIQTNNWQKYRNIAQSPFRVEDARQRTMSDLYTNLPFFQSESHPS